MSIYGIRSGGYPATAGYPYGRTERGTGTGVYAKYAETLQGSDRADGNFVLHYFDHEDGERAVARKKLTASYNGVPLRRSADDKKYTDKETGISYYVADGNHPYITGEDVEKLKELCAATGEPLLKKMGEITGMIRHLDENTTAYVGDNGTVIKSKDGRELSINTSLLSYDVLSFMFRNIGSSGDYFNEKYWSGKIQDAVGNYLTGGK